MACNNPVTTYNKLSAIETCYHREATQTVTCNEHYCFFDVESPLRIQCNPNRASPETIRRCIRHMHRRLGSTAGGLRSKRSLVVQRDSRQLNYASHRTLRPHYSLHCKIGCISIHRTLVTPRSRTVSTSVVVPDTVVVRLIAAQTAGYSMQHNEVCFLVVKYGMTYC